MLFKHEPSLPEDRRKNYKRFKIAILTLLFLSGAGHLFPDFIIPHIQMTLGPMSLQQWMGLISVSIVILVAGNEAIR